MQSVSRNSIYDPQAVEKLRRQHQLDPEYVRRFRTAVCKHFREDAEIIDALPMARELRLHWLEISRRLDSELDGATKLLLKNERGMLIESVILRIASGRTTLCVSSQVGCAAACDFCATGKMGVAQNLSVEEILDQIVLAGQILSKEDRRLRNIVFMGMGEPFHNEANLFEALQLLTSSVYFHHTPNRILVSTVGVTDAMIRCARRFPKVNLALSLHSVRQSVREQLIPIAKQHPLDQLKLSLKMVNELQACPVMVEYLMLAGVNDSAEDASELADWLKGLDVHVNLIPFNPIEDAPHLTASDDETIQSFSEHLKMAGLKTTTRYSLGSDIAAACGQLVRQENRQIAKSMALKSG